jgi:biopolymer transport protein TolR
MPRPRKSINQINVVPYIDVMLVLLIIFMVTAPLINPGEIELPTVGRDLAAPVAPIELTIRQDRTLWLQDRAGSDPARATTREEMLAYVRSRLARNPDQPVVIAADKAVRYEDVVAVLDLLQRNQVRRVGLLAQSTGR